MQSSKNVKELCCTNRCSHKIKSLEEIISLRPNDVAFAFMNVSALSLFAASFLWLADRCNSPVVGVKLVFLFFVFLISRVFR